MKPKPVKRATNVKAELLEEEEPETEEYQLNYIKNYYGEVHYHVYGGGQIIEMAGNPPPLPPYGGG